jgi:ABC-type multidrug transport system ATPase subunit
MPRVARRGDLAPRASAHNRLLLPRYATGCSRRLLWPRVPFEHGGVAVAVELQGVTKTYGPVRALVGVSWRFVEGRVAVVSGPNGSGKSTLLSIVGTLTRPTSGKVDHGELGRRREDVRRTLGWLGHESLCYPDLTGRQNLELAAQLFGCDAGHAFSRAAERFDLGAFANRPVRTYSRGQRQRIALARALVNTPRLLLLDEPTTGLDTAAFARLVTVVREEAAHGAVVIVVTHDARFADAVADDALTLDRGRPVNG